LIEANCGLLIADCGLKQTETETKRDFIFVAFVCFCSRFFMPIAQLTGGGRLVKL